jgi:two-component system response regulator RegA
MARGAGRKVTTVLLVDDEDELFLRPLARSFRRLVPNVHTALDGKRALELAQKVRPDLVVIDERMPGMSGIETIAKLRTQLPDAFVILHSCLDDEDLRDAADRAGADDFVEKPASAAELLALAESQGTLAKITRSAVERTLRECEGNKTRAARRLGLSRRGLQKMLSKF